jgi:hypothetical protein
MKEEILDETHKSGTIIIGLIAYVPAFQIKDEDEPRRRKSRCPRPPLRRSRVRRRSLRPARHLVAAIRRSSLFANLLGEGEEGGPSPRLQDYLP